MYAVSKRRRSRGNLFLFLFALLVLAPLLMVLGSFVVGESEHWDHIVQVLLADYVLNTVWLAIAVPACSLMIGTATAWFVTQYSFFGRNVLSWALIIPLALPAYMSAYTYAGMLDYTGIAQVFFRNYLGLDAGQYPVINLMNIPGCIFILTLALYPYVYLAAKASFSQQSCTSLEAARMLGMHPFRAFCQVALPLSRPALVGGAALVLMETLNEYGAVHYFGVTTFTVGILRVRFALGDLTAALRLSAFLLLGILFVLTLEKHMRGRRRFDFSGGQYRPYPMKRATGGWRIFFPVFCSIPVLLGFVVPVGQLIVWSIHTANAYWNSSFVHLIFDSFVLSGIATIAILFVSVALVHILRGREGRIMSLFTNLFNVGYTVPGVVLAIGFMAYFGSTDRFIRNVFSSTGYLQGLILSGSLFGLIMAYVIRFIAVSNKQVGPGIGQVTRTMHEASRSLGKNSLQSLFLIDIPLSKLSFLGAGLLVFIEILKELPLTIILRPFNFDTLATRSFELASDEMLSMSAPPSIMIVAVSMVAIVFLHRIFANKRTRDA